MQNLFDRLYQSPRYRRLAQVVKKEPWGWTENQEQAMKQINDMGFAVMNHNWKFRMRNHLTVA